MTLLTFSRHCSRCPERLVREVATVVALTGNVRIGRELVPGIDDAAIGRSVAHWIIGEGLRGEQQWVTRRGRAVQLIVAEGLIPSAIRQTCPIADRVIDIIGFVDGHAGGREFMQDVRDLGGGIISRHRMV